MTRTAIYARVSVDRDGDAGSIPAQLAAARTFAEAKGWEVTAEYQDAGVSAFSGKDRPGWLRVEQAVTSGEVDAVVVFAISRAARNAVRLLTFAETCEAQGVQFESVSEPIGGRFGKVFLGILGSLAELESQMKSDRAKLGRKTMESEGRWGGGRRPFGYRIVGEPGDYRLEVDPSEATLIREGVTALLNGGSLTSLANRWNLDGVKTTGGSTWTTSHVKMMLSRDLPGIVSVRDLAALRVRFPAGGSKTARRLLTGLLVCSEDGNVLQSRGPTYVCNGGVWHGPVHMSVRRDALEEHVVREADGRTLTEALAASDPSEPLEAERDRIERAMEELGESDLPEAVLRGRARKLERELEAVGEAIAKLAPARAEIDFERFFTPGMEEADMRAWLESLIERITIKPGTRGANRFDPSRVTITWRPGVK